MDLAPFGKFPSVKKTTEKQFHNLRPRQQEKKLWHKVHPQILEQI